MRAQRRDPRREQPLAAAPTAAEPVAAGGTPSQAAIGREHTARLEAAIAALPEDYQQVLALARLLCRVPRSPCGWAAARPRCAAC